MNNTRLKYIKLCLAILFIFAGTTGISYGQGTSEQTVKGSVISAVDSKPLVGINLRVGTFSSAITDENGNFSILIPDRSATLTISGEGYQDKEVAVRGRTEVTIRLYDIGFKTNYGTAVMPMGTRSKTSVTGAISTIQNTSINSYISADQLLDGEVAGMRSIMQSGAPGSAATMFIRGLNSLNASARPLVVVDGMVMETNAFNSSIMDGNIYNPISSIDVKDIANITVIKDATSVYGAKAGNGVILIETTKTKDLSTSIDFYVQGGMNIKPDFLPTMNSTQYRSFLVDQIGTSNLFTETELNLLPYLNENRTFTEYTTYHNNTNWQDEVFRNSYNTDYYLKVTGGDDIARYGISLGYMNNDGIVKNTDFSRLTTRFNAESSIAKKLLMKANLSVNYQSNEIRDNGIDNLYSPVYLSLLKSPMLNPFVADDLGLFTVNYAGVDSIARLSNPTVLVDNVTGENKNYKLFGNISLVYTIKPNLRLSSLFGVNLDRNRDNVFYPGNGIGYNITTYGDTTYRTSYTRVEQLFAFYNDTRISYEKQLNLTSRLLINAGVRYNVNNYLNVFSLSGNSSDDQFTALGNGNKATFITNGNAGTWKWTSVYLNADYAYLNKYFVDFNMSVDGSSRFGKDAEDGLKLGSHKFAIFPSVGAAWLISSEDFMNNVSLIDQLKLRASIGLTGNDGIGNYVAESYFTSRRFLEGTGIVSGNLANSQIQWEKTTKFNVGIDLGLFDERVALTFDFFNNTTDKLLNVKIVNPIFGYNSYLNNDGKLKNTGIELGLNGRIVNGTDFKWDIGANLSTYKNKILSLPGGTDEFTIEGVNATIINKEESPIGLFYGYQTDGIYNTQAEADADGLTWIDAQGFSHGFRAGDMKFMNTDNSDNIINNNDRVVIGDPNPDFTGAFFNKLTYKKFSLDVVFTFTKGNDIYNALRAKTEAMTDFSNQSAAVANRWKVENQVTSIPRAEYGDPTGNSRFSDRWIEDGSYMRLKNLTLSYSPDLKLNFIKGVTFFVSANNLFTFTKYLGYDPEVSMSANSYVQGIDAGMVPQFTSLFAGFRLGL
jgi:TonB-linked SusC/RagA family outer membrane protein